jgi:hypothetical protein
LKFVLSAGKAPLWPADRRWPARYLIAAGLTGLVLILAACGGQAPDVALPKKSSATPTATAAVTQHKQTPAELAAAAYLGYWQAYAAAMTAGHRARARSILAPYETAAGLPHLLSSLQQVWAAHEVAYGSADPHVLSVHVTGRRALLHDCLDLSHFGVLDKVTGRVVPTSFGLPNLDFYVTLVLSGGRWRVSNMQPVEVPCKP